MDSYSYLHNEFGIAEEVLEISRKAEEEIKDLFAGIDRVGEFNQLKVLKALQKNRLSDAHFSGSTGYGYNDLGRETLEAVYADTFKTELALVRPQIISGTHALTLALFGNLRHGDEMISPLGKPYDTMEKIIGIKPARGSLAEHGVTYKQVDLTQDGKVDYSAIKSTVSNKTKLVLIQRSKGYAYRHSFHVDEIKELIEFIKGINPNIICMVDNCYGEFVDIIEPSEVGADLIVGSLIKNPGGGLAAAGGYIAGKKEYVENAAYRLTSPGLGFEVGPMFGLTASLIQGFYMAPQVVASSLKSATFAAKIFELLNYEVLPASREKRSDIVQAIKFLSPDRVVKFCQGIQKGAAVDSFVLPQPWDMPGYDCPVIMASGSFVQGSSIELSADAPMREPFVAYLQGGLTWFHAKAGIIIAVDNLYKAGILNPPN